jgi:hypothetical protein
MLRNDRGLWQAVLVTGLLIVGIALLKSPENRSGEKIGEGDVQQVVKPQTPSWFTDVDPNAKWVEPVQRTGSNSPDNLPTGTINLLPPRTPSLTPLHDSTLGGPAPRSDGTATAVAELPSPEIVFNMAVSARGRLLGQYGGNISGGSSKEVSGSPGTKPQIWKQDAHRPTFARVYLGDNNSLELVSLQVTVTIDGPRARTVVDHIFHNPHDKQLEGTFEYPLPTGASPSYYAMFEGQTRDTVPPRFAGRLGEVALPADALAGLAPVQLVKHVSSDDWGKLQEAKIVRKDKALESYEDTIRRRIDPALLEYAGGNTFSGRVFPIPKKGFNRVLLAYEETLPVIDGKSIYRFALPDCKLQELQVNLQANAEQCKNAAFQPEGEKTNAGERISFNKSWKDKGPGGDALFSFTAAEPRVQAISGRVGPDGPTYLYARIRPELKAERTQAFAEHAVFLLDTSLSEHPDRFEVNMKLLRRILEQDPDIKKFNILTFNAGTAWVEPRGWLANTAAGREKAFDRLDGLVLEGATDITGALDKLSESRPQGEPGALATGAPFSATGAPFSAKGVPLNIFLLSDGQATWGERETAGIAARFESRCQNPVRFHCYRIGLGAENQELFETLTRKGGAIVQCRSEAEINAAAIAHRNQCMQIQNVRIEGTAQVSDLLVAGRQAAVYPGGEVTVAARLKEPGKATIVLEGTYLGKPVREEYPVSIGMASELAPRGWAEIAVASLLSLNDPRLDGLITAYCQRFGIGSKVASFLVLATEKEYEPLNLAEECNNTLKGDLGQYLVTAWTDLGQELPPRAEMAAFFSRIDSRIKLLDGANSAQVRSLLELLRESDFELPPASVAGEVLHKSDVPEAYLKALNARDRDVAAFLVESQRRLKEKDTAGAIRALSSVIELYPTRGDALRLVGYRLLDMQQPAQAAHLFRQVQRDRPFEPHSYRDLARSLEEAGKFGLAALQYEIILAGEWDARFRTDLKKVVHEEFVHMMHEALHRKQVDGKLAEHFGERLKDLAAASKPCDLRVTISWNTDNTDVDLWVFEPDGTKCYYQNRKTTNGGELSEDCTQGYGPERFQAEKAVEGEYRIAVDYFRANPNLLAGETHVQVTITRGAGTPEEETVRRTVVLKEGKQVIEVGRVRFGKE